MRSCYRVALSGGDTVGPELVKQAVKVFHALEVGGDVLFDLSEFCSCGMAIDRFGDPLPASEMDRIEGRCAVLLGNVGSRRYAKLPSEIRPEAALLRIRRRLNVCTNLRPVTVYPGMESMSPLKPEFLENGFDILMVRDIMGGMLTGPKKLGNGAHGREASDLEFYDELIIGYSARLAFMLAAGRRRQVTSIDKANVLASSALWREKVTEISGEFPDIALNHRLVDSMAMDVICNVGRYDVIVTGNIFGDILSDEITQLTGTPELFGSAELGPDNRGIYTPNQLHHPRGEEMVGTGTVSPVGILEAVAMLLRYSCDRSDLADRVEKAIQDVLRKGLCTLETKLPGGKSVTTEEFGTYVAELIQGVR